MAVEHKLLKRKGGVDPISDDFSDFSLSSPATKIRRLDAELPPIVEEDEPVPLPTPNNERALVLFKPLNHHSPSSFSLTVDSELLSGIKNQYPWAKQRDCDRLIGSSREDDDDDENDRFALVPWIPPPSASSSSSQLASIDDSENANGELMEADEMEAGDASMMMDVEQEDTATPSAIHHHSLALNLNQHHQGVAGMNATVPEGFQQHCLLPQFPQNTSTPITWTR